MSTALPPTIELAQSHLLLLDAQSGFSDVVALAGNRDPRLSFDGPRADPDRHGRADIETLVLGRGLGVLDLWTARLSRHSFLAGPIAVDAAMAQALGLPEWVEKLVVLSGPRQRESEPPPDWFRDVEGRAELFPHGLPEQEEGRNLDLLAAIARRLQTALRLADEPGSAAARLLVPDYGRAHDITVYSALWLSPELLLERVRAVEPGAEFPAEISAAAQARARELMAPGDEGVIPDGYAVEVPLSFNGQDAGEVELGVYVEEAPPELLADRAEAFVGYQIRWIDPEFGSEHQSLGEEFQAMRVFASERIDRLAGAVIRAANGVAFDSDGFLVAEHQLG